MRFLLIHYLDDTAKLKPAEDPGAEGSAAAIEMREFLPLGRPARNSPSLAGMTVWDCSKSGPVP